MSEERMIRVTKFDFFTGGMDDGMLVPHILDDANWNALEPAPPKDWIPHCHDGDKEYGCSGSIDHTLHLFPRCVKCPWRNNKYDKCIYKEDEPLILASSPYDENGFKPMVIRTDEAAERFIQAFEQAEKRKMKK